MLLLRGVGEKWFSWLPSCASDCGKDDDCWKEQMTYRTAFSTSMVFLLLCVISMCGLQKSAMLKYFFIKFAGIPLLLFASLFIPNDFFDAIRGIAVILSILFTFAQMVLLLDFGHAWNNLWLENCLEDQRRDLNNTGRKWIAGIVAFSLLFLAFTITVTTIMAQNFENTGSKVVNWTNFSIGGLISLLSVTSLFPHGSVLPSMITFAFSTYVAWAACLANVNEICGTNEECPADVTVNENMHDPTALQVFGFLFMALALGSYLRDPSLLRLGDAEGSLPADVEKASEDSGEDSGPEVGKSSSVAFFFIHFTAALYVIPLICHQRSVTAFWANAVGNWLVLLAFGWTIVGPEVLDTRDFGGTSEMLLADYPPHR